jgi:hypothetical protein
LGGWGELIGDIFSVASERADLRAWQTLPNTWQGARVFLPAGRHELNLGAEGGPSTCLGTFELQKGETMFIFARTIGTQLFVHPIGGSRVEATAPVPSPGT